MKKIGDLKLNDNRQFLQVIISGCKFKYASYDFNNAYEEYKLIEDNNCMHEMFPISEKDRKELASEYMPKELKEKHKVWRIGKLRKIHFNPNGEAFKFEIGNKRSKTFYRSDFGIEVFPIISEDK